MDYTDILTTLNSPKAVLTAGFLSGFIYNFKLSKRTLNYPLSTLFNSALSGMITLFGSSFLLKWFHEDFRFIIPLTVATSCIYWKYTDLFYNKKNKPFILYKHKSNDGITSMTVGNDSSEEEKEEKQE